MNTFALLTLLAIISIILFFSLASKDSLLTYDQEGKQAGKTSNKISKMYSPFSSLSYNLPRQKLLLISQIRHRMQAHIDLLPLMSHVKNQIPLGNPLTARRNAARFLFGVDAGRWPEGHLPASTPNLILRSANALSLQRNISQRDQKSGMTQNKILDDA